MSVQVRRRRESAAFLASFVGAQGELLVDTTNNRVQVHDGMTPGGWPAAKLADVAQRTAVADTAYKALATDRTVAYIALTAARTLTLPAASAYPGGATLTIVDESGACSPTLALTIAATGSDLINGAATTVLSTAYGYLALESNTANKWTVIDAGGSGVATTQQLTNRNAIVNGNFAFNQRAYSSNTALSAGIYGHDRWKAGSGGATYTFNQAVPDTTATLTAGTLVQVVEGANVPAATLWLTWTGTAAARVYQGTASSQTSPAYASGTAATISGMPVNVLAVTGLTVGTNTSVEFSGGSVGLVQLEAMLPTAGPTRFERRQVAAELALCQRYFQVQGLSMRFPAAGGNQIFASAFTLAAMRATPTATLVSAGVRSSTVSQVSVGFLTSASGAFSFISNQATGGDCYALQDVWSFGAEL